MAWVAVEVGKVIEREWIGKDREGNVTRSEMRIGRGWKVEGTGGEGRRS